MKYILLLSIITIISFWLVYLIYKNTKSISIILGFLLIYYWTFNGAWLYVYDVLSGFHGKDFGLAYYIIEIKMFPLHLDGDYFTSLFYYGVFYISIQLTMLWWLRKKNLRHATNEKVPISLINSNLLIISFSALILSYICVHHKFIEAYETKTSLYYMLRGTPNRFNTLHMVFNLISVFTSYLFLITYFSKKSARYFILSNTSKYWMIPIFINILIVSIYFTIIGNKHDLMFAGIFGILFYVANNYRIEWKKVVFFFLIIASPLTLTDFIRGLPLLNYASKFQDEDALFLSRKIPSYANVIFNNEMFYAHFSMYGTLSRDVELTHGRSFVSLAESFIPRVLKEKRGEDAYMYYAKSVGAKEGQGYTIHHATGWYVNFGFIGVLLGGIFWGSIWAYFVRKNASVPLNKKKFLIIVFAMAPSLFVAFIPSFIRGGFEAYKPLLIEAILLPSVIVFLSQIDVFRYLRLTKS